MSARTTLPPAVPLPVGPTTDDGLPRPFHWDGCFGCGTDQPDGLGLRFGRDGDRVVSAVTLRLRHQGAPGLAHGGIVAAILDDVSGAVPMILGERAVTAKLEVDFTAPVVLDRPLVAEAWLASHEGRKMRIVSRLLEDDATLAVGHALFLSVPREHFTAHRDGPPGAPRVAP